MKLSIRLLAILLLVLGPVLVAKAAPSSELRASKELRGARTGAVVSDHIIVKFKRGVSKPGKKAVHRGAGTSSRKPPSADFEIVDKPPGMTADELVAKYRARPEVKYAELDHVMTAFMVPNDPLFSSQWHFSNPVYGGINLEPAWDITTGGGVIVAVVDTGIAYENYAVPGPDYFRAPDLAATSFVPGYDFINNDVHANDDNAHGTHVAGTIAQSTNNGLGVAGIAFGATLMPVKVLDKNGNGTDATVAAGIRYAADNGAKVINLSLGGSSSPALQDAVTYAYNKGVTVVAATGNENGPVSYPAAYDQVIAVAATRYDEARAWYSNFGAQVDVAAPGGDTALDQNVDGYADGVMQNTFNPDTKNRNDFAYWFFQGTSMATPHVAGLAALLLSQDASMTPSDVKNRLQSTAEDKGAPGWDQYYGWGIINAGAALSPASYELLVSSIDLQAVAAGVSTWPGDDAKNKPVTINATVPWALTVRAEANFAGGGQALPSTNLQMGPSYGEVVAVPTGGPVQVAAGAAGSNTRPDLNTTLDVPWTDGLADKTLTTTLTYTVLPQ